MSPIKIMFVCTGNTCRSPMAAVMATQLFAEAGLVAEVFSAGLYAINGQPASHNAISVMKESGLCLLSHRAAPVSGSILSEIMLVLTMTWSHREALQLRYPSAQNKIFTLAEFVGDSMNIADPYGGDLEEYRACAAQIKTVLIQVVEKFKSKGNMY